MRQVRLISREVLCNNVYYMTPQRLHAEHLSDYNPIIIGLDQTDGDIV